jgi:MSHA biogenesis protein MshO
MVKRPAPGFTLVELIVVMVVMGIVAGILSMMLAPAFQSYMMVARRANLTQHADTALRRILGDVRSAVPNSLRVLAPSAGVSCLEMVPTTTGGRFRTDVDITATAAAPSDPLDLSQADDIFDVLTTLSPLPAANDWVVIGNQNTDDLYGLTSPTREQISLIATPAPSSFGQHRITLKAKHQFPYGYEGGRFSIVPDAQQAVTYFCTGAGVDASGTGTGTLNRYSHYGFPATQTTCQPAGAGVIVKKVATRVSSCNFIYNASSGATQQSGFVQLQMTLSDNNEAATLSVGAQVENMP